MMHPTGFEMIRRFDEERREISLRRFWWRHVRPEPEPERITEAEVIELVFGPRCEAEGSIGA